MRREGVPIQTLLLRTFLPAVVIVAIALAAIVYNRLYATILDGFDNEMVTTSLLTGALIDPADHDWLIEAARPGADAAALEDSPQYLRNVEPMRRIQEKLGLTYLYSQVIGGSLDIVYILDATEGAEHSPIGSEDDLPDETVAGLRRTMARGIVYVSPIEYQEQWGLLKTAAAPLRGSDGRITATVGADVNISLIQVATQNALFESAVIGIASILACLAVALLIVARVARPIERLKQEALRIAAGDHAPPPGMAKPREVSALRNALATLARKTADRLVSAREAASEHEQARTSQFLERLLQGDAAKATVTLVDHPEWLVVWIAGEENGLETGLRRRAMIALAARISAVPELAARWKDFIDLKHGSFVIVDRNRAQLRLVGHAPVKVRAGDKDITLNLGDAVALAPHAPLTILLPQGPLSVRWEAAR